MQAKLMAGMVGRCYEGAPRQVSESRQALAQMRMF
jgi:hypothetical protein